MKKTILIASITGAFLWAPQVVACQEISMVSFLNLIEKGGLSDEQIRLFTKGEKIEEPLRQAQEQKREVVIQRLLEARDKHGDTPLLCAVQGNDEELAKKLLDAGADPNGANPRKLVSAMVSAQDYSFHTRFPLSVAALSTINPEMVQLLLNGGAFDSNYEGKNSDSLATTVLKYTHYRRHGAQQKADLKEIEKRLLLASRQRLLSDALRRDGGQEGKDGGAVQQLGDSQKKFEKRSREALSPENEETWWKAQCIVS